MIKLLPAAALALAAPLTAGAEPAQPAAVAPRTAPLDPQAIALAREILDLASPPAEREATLRNRMKLLWAQAMDSAGQKFNLPQLQADASSKQAKGWDEYAEIFGREMPAYFEAISRAYAKRFSLDELRQIRDFAKTPAGRRFVSLGTVIYKDPDVIEAQRRMMDNAMGEMAKRAKTALPAHHSQN